ncbi:MAG: UPF0179 family protein [Methanolobus sp.]|uniref:UPF0179 family protein n=1 Tax=Methanolobus sp. TaxID=1874737 RepID=UPI00273012D5|nr:UPF0179 family protein [Methanolobus sp.]MDP2217885.1 UPF0179 family protein [Methanolobus sp.]
MTDTDTTITLVGSRLAKEGADFMFFGESRECQKCKLKRTCMNLEPGRKYRIVKLRGDTVHECFVHDAGVLAVEVVTSPILAAIDSKKAIAGARISYETPKCTSFDDSLYDLINPEGIRNGDKCTVAKVLENIDEGLSGCSLKKVELKL